VQKKATSLPPPPPPRSHRALRSLHLTPIGLAAPCTPALFSKPDQKLPTVLADVGEWFWDGFGGSDGHFCGGFISVLIGTAAGQEEHRSESGEGDEQC
jgi:hypothetical protein